MKKLCFDRSFYCTHSQKCSSRNSPLTAFNLYCWWRWELYPTHLWETSYGCNWNVEPYVVASVSGLFQFCSLLTFVYNKPRLGPHVSLPSAAIEYLLKAPGGRQTDLRVEATSGLPQDRPSWPVLAQRAVPAIHLARDWAGGSGGWWADPKSTKIFLD